MFAYDEINVLFSFIHSYVIITSPKPSKLALLLFTIAIMSIKTQRRTELLDATVPLSYVTKTSL